MPPLTLDGTTGVSAVQTGAVESGDLASGAIGSGDLPSGSVIQVVSPDLSSISGTTITSLSFVATAALASITPSSTSNKIFVIVSTNLRAPGGAQGVEAAIYRDSTRITSSSAKPNDGALLFDGSAENNHWVFNTCVLDAPNSVSSITYRLHIASHLGGIVAHRADWGLTTLTLMEIAG